MKRTLKNKIFKKKMIENQYQEVFKTMHMATLTTLLMINDFNSYHYWVLKMLIGCTIIVLFNIKIKSWLWLKTESSSWTNCTVNGFINFGFKNVAYLRIFLFVFSSLCFKHICFLNPFSSSFFWFAFNHFHLNHQITGFFVSLFNLHSLIF